MSVADSVDDLSLHEVELRAARGELPDWARVTPSRREHMARVAALLEGWARDLGLDDTEALRWVAAGWLHDVLRDAAPAELVQYVSSEEKHLPPAVLHGPAAATRLRDLVDPRVERAIRFHTTGSPRLEKLGRALYLADFLEPGRDFLADWRAGLRARMPADLPNVLVEVLAARLTHRIEHRLPVQPETAAFWTDALEQART